MWVVLHDIKILQIYNRVEREHIYQNVYSDYLWGLRWFFTYHFVLSYNVGFFFPTENELFFQNKKLYISYPWKSTYDDLNTRACSQSLIPLPPEHTAILHFSSAFAVRCGHVTNSFNRIWVEMMCTTSGEEFLRRGCITSKFFFPFLQLDIDDKKPLGDERATRQKQPGPITHHLQYYVEKKWLEWASLSCSWS